MINRGIIKLSLSTIIPTICLLFIANHGYSQVDSIQTASYIFWSSSYELRMNDFQDTLGTNEYKNLCDSIGLCWGAWVGLFSALDEPKKKRKRGKLMERIHFAPAFNKSKSYRLNDDRSEYLNQLLVFDMYELTARKCRKDLQSQFDQIPAYGTKSLFYKTIESRNTEFLKGMIAGFVREVYRSTNENTYSEWRSLIDEMLHDTKEYKTKNADRLRFISNKPLSNDYQMAETVIGDFNRHTE